MTLLHEIKLLSYSYRFLVTFPKFFQFHLHWLHIYSQGGFYNTQGKWDKRRGCLERKGGVLH